MKKLVSGLIVIGIIGLSTLSFAASFAGKEDPKVTSLVTKVKEEMKRQNVKVEGLSCVVSHEQQKALCYVRIMEEKDTVTVTFPYSEL